MRNPRKLPAFAAKILAGLIPLATLALSAFGQTTFIRGGDGTLYLFDAASQTLTWDDENLMVPIPAGEFEMGSNDGQSDERPVHQVELDAFFIDQHEVTVERYARCVSAGKCDTPATGTYFNWGKSDRRNHPVNGVDWDDAKNFCSYEDKRLPTEAEWERAATWKDGTKYKYPSGKDSVSCTDAVMDDGGNGCGKNRTWPVGSKPEEINGTYDMAGNVWEWVHDWYGAYPADKRTNPKGPATGSSRVNRGGSWGGNASRLRGAIRNRSGPASRLNYLGFRCVVSSAAGL